jgi:HD superfamily phosphodiesterase
METLEIVPTVAQYAEQALGKEKFRYVSSVVASCKMLALQLESEQEQDEGDSEAENASPAIDMEALIIAAYLHDISASEHGAEEHQRMSAEMALDFLQDIDVPEERIKKVEQAILLHTAPLPAGRREEASIEARILYDADQLGRLSGLAVVTSLIEFGARYPNRAINGDALAAILRHIEERFVELYQSLYTAPAREMAQAKFGNTLAFLDGVIEHLSDATPV